MTTTPTNAALSLDAAGWCGIAAGAGLAVEAALWIASGWSPATFASPDAAIEFMSTGGAELRWASLAGFANLALLVAFNIGLCAHLAGRTPTAAAVSLWLGMIGITVHLLVPLSHWYGVPILVEAGLRDRQAAEASWTALYIVAHEAAGGGGKLFIGLSMVVAGWAIAVHRALPMLLGWLCLATGVAEAITILAPGTPVSPLANALFMPGLLLSIVVRVALGLLLVRQAMRAPASLPASPGNARA